MSCTGCGSEFGMFKKQVGCDICGFGFCSKCCSKKLIFESTNGKKGKQTVCNTCFDKNTSSESKKTTYSPPLAHKKRMAAMANRSMSLGTGKQQIAFENATDKDIAERLQKLKRERTRDAIPDNEEIQERLAKLKGINPSVYKAPPLMVFRPTERKQSADETSDLIQQISEEVKIESKILKPEDEIAERLARLRDEPVPPKKSSEEVVIPSEYATETKLAEVDMMDALDMIQRENEKTKNEAFNELKNLEKNDEYKTCLSKTGTRNENVSEDSDSSEDADEMMKKLLEMNIDDDIGGLDSLNSNDQIASPDEEMANEKDQDFDPEEFPWCVICSENAVIRCFSCDSDLYCMRCFRETHDSLDIKDHKTCPFLSPKK